MFFEDPITRRLQSRQQIEDFSMKLAGLFHISDFAKTLFPA